MASKADTVMRATWATAVAGRPNGVSTTNRRTYRDHSNGPGTFRDDSTSRLYLGDELDLHRLLGECRSGRADEGARHQRTFPSVSGFPHWAFGRRCRRRRAGQASPPD
jgi:hypothetical protein